MDKLKINVWSFLQKSFRKRSTKISLLILALVVAFVWGKSLLLVALVNGKPITRYQVIRELEKQGGSQILDTIIERSLIFQQARKEGVEIEEKTIKAQIEEIEKTLRAQDITLEDALEARGQTRSDLVTQIRIKKTVEKLLADKINVTDEEVSNYYKENDDYFQGKKFDEVKEDIRAQLYQQELNDEYQNWMKELKEKAKIYYLKKYI